MLPPSFRDHAADSSPYERGQTRENARHDEPARRGQVRRLPYRIELVLVVPQSLEVVEVLAGAKRKGADPGPDAVQRPILEARERGHAEVEPAESLVASPQHQVEEDVVHHAFGCIAQVAHQVDGQLLATSARPEICERDGTAVLADQCDRAAADVRLVEETEGEALFARALV